MGKISIQKVEQDKFGNVSTIDETRMVDIKPLNPWQYISASKILKNMADKLKDDNSVQDLIQQIAETIEEDSTWQDIIRVGGKEMVNSGLGSISFLLDVVPEDTIDLVSVASRIDKAELLNQDTDTFFDIIDECVEVNDIQGLIDRLKKSTKSLAKKVNFQKLTEQATSNNQQTITK